MFKEIIENVKGETPLVHCITNTVTMNDCANAILAVNGSPIMADDEFEVEEITSLCKSLVINIGTLNQRTIASMIKAGKKANQLGHPVILDPVGAGASHLRTEIAQQLLSEVQFSVIKGNVSEIKTIAQGSGQTKGVDVAAGDMVNLGNINSYIEFAKELSQKTGAVIVMSGVIDIIADATQAYTIHNGCQEMARITGTGCMLGAIMGAYAGANSNCILEAVTCAVAIMGYSGELARDKIMKKNAGTGSFRVYLIDYLSQMTHDLLERGIKIEKQ